LADLCRVSLWHWEVRSVGAYDTAGSEPVSPNVPPVIVALATGWHHPSRELRNLLAGAVLKAVRERR
jgi:hypothetical protein